MPAQQNPSGWKGRFLEDFAVGDVYRSRLGRTISEADNTWFTLLTNNTNQMHFNAEYGQRMPLGVVLVNSCLTLSIVVGLTVVDTSQNAVANLEWSDIRLPNPVVAGDTLWAETEVLAVRESASRPDAGLVSVRSRGLNQRGQVVVEFRRTFMVPRRGVDVAGDVFPSTDAPWTVDQPEP